MPNTHRDTATGEGRLVEDRYGHEIQVLCKATAPGSRGRQSSSSSTFQYEASARFRKGNHSR
jgi:hypothetical protein